MSCTTLVSRVTHALRCCWPVTPVSRDACRQQTSLLGRNSTPPLCHLGRTTPLLSAAADMMRHRPRQHDNADDDSDAEEEVLLTMEREKYPSTQSLLATRPAKVGWLMKKNERCLGLLNDWWCCRPRWKPRFFVLTSGHLFRYKSDSARRPKGTPLPMEASEIKALDGGDDEPFCLEVGTLRKSYVLQASSAGERDEWINLMRAAKREAIKVSMGHSRLDEMQSEVNKIGKRMYEEAVQREIREQQSSIEMAEKNSMMGGAFGGGAIGLGGAGSMT